MPNEKRKPLTSVTVRRTDYEVVQAFAAGRCISIADAIGIAFRLVNQLPPQKVDQAVREYGGEKIELIPA